MNRRPTVAGQFYPGNPDRLKAFLVQHTSAPGAERNALGIVSPHAGYIYSGAVAGKVFTATRVTDTVVLLGPNHTGMGTPASIVSSGTWDTPLGPVPVDEELAADLKSACPLLEEDSLAHAHEHSLEVQLPFLQYLNPAVKIVPIAFMLRGLDEIREIGAGLGQFLAAREQPVLMVASSDMSHYESHDSAKSKDQLAIDKMLALDPVGLLAVTREHRISMCGVIPAAVMLFAAQHLGVTRAELVAYDTSAAASGDYNRVVGYAGIALWK